MILKIKRLNAHTKMPVKAHATDSGFDVALLGDIYIWPFGVRFIPLGFAVELEPGYELQIRPRSSLSKRGILCHFGTVDEGYRGEVAVVLSNITHEGFAARQGDHLVQIVVAHRASVEIIEVEELSDSPRGANGFGSTGA